MTTPVATESPPIKPPTPPEDKKIVLKKSVGGKWEMKLIGPVKRSDINHIRRLIQVEYARTKRRERLVARKESKETSDAARP